MKAGSSFSDFEIMKQQERAAYLLAGYFQYDLNADEEEELDKWINSSEANLKLFEELTDEKRMAEYLQWYSSTDVEARLDAAKQQVNAPPPIRHFSWWKYAAAAVLLVTAGMLFYFMRTPAQPGSLATHPFLRAEDGSMIQLSSEDMRVGDYARMNNGVLMFDGKAVTGKMQELVAPRKTFSRLVLADGTKVWLNAASSIKFPGVFGAIREVLITGECYFEVAPDAAPMIVSVNGLKVQAIGTAFNIKAYPGDPYVSITMTEGSVRVSDGARSQELRSKDELKVSGAGRWTVQQVNVDDVVAWTDSKLHFSDVDVNELKRTLERMYDVEVIIQDKIDKHFNGTFSRNIPLTTLLKTLEQTRDVHFKVDGNRVTVFK